MSDKTRGEHAASPRRRKEARQRGHVPRSREFVFATMYALCGATLVGYGPQMILAVRERLQADLRSAAQPLADPLTYLQQYLLQLAWWLLPWLLVISLAAILAHWVQHGPLWLPHRVQCDFGRLHPIRGLQRLLQPGFVVVTALSWIKIALLGSLAVWQVRNQWDSLLGLSTSGFQHLGVGAAVLLCRLGAWLGVGLLVWGGIDFAWQLFRHERELQMTPEELRDEVKAVHNDVSAAHRRQPWSK